MEHTLAKEYLRQFIGIWQCFSSLADFIRQFGETLDGQEYEQISPEIWVHKSAKISQYVHLGAPCIVGRNSEIRHCAFIRGSALIGESCVVGNSTEIKNSILFDGACVPHFNYIGDSILGFRAHLGAGAITSNVRCDKATVKICGEDTRLKKLGALIGDGVEVGCNSVLNPGTVVGKNAVIYPLSSVRGIVEKNSIFKNKG